MIRFVVLLSTLAALATIVPTSAQDKKKKDPVKRQATSPDSLNTAKDFKVELLYTSDPATEGSWINMTKDNKGRLLIGGQRGQPILRMTIKDGKVDKVEKLNLPITETMGMLYAHDSLYINGAGPGAGYGLFRCKDTKGTDQFDDVKLLKDFKSGGEHGAHGIVLGPDKQLYIMNGNHTDVPDGLSPDSPLKNYHEDHLLPRQWDGNGHAAGKLAPGGYVLRTDPEGKKWELVLGGFRNAYDHTFNADGELFTFDSDMEWDWGMPWYRPTRVNHCVSGAEFGWRSGTGVWPDYYLDNLPTTANIGIGSPTGVGNGIGAKFPAKYQKAIYILDWTYGRIIAVHLTPKGSSYSTTFENFVAPKGLDGTSPKAPLNVTDLVIGDDGAMYFTIGGRNTQAALYRVTYTGSEPTSPANLHDEAGAKERKLRHEIEAFHGKKDPKAVATAWPHLNSDDRFLSSAARVAIEAQPVAEWKAQALAEKQPTASLNALLALVRMGSHDTQADVLAALERLPLSSLSDEQKLAKLRVIGLSILRQGPPKAEPTKKIIAECDALFPGSNEILNRELVQILIALRAPNIAAKSLKQMATAKTQQDQMHYLFHLRTLPIGNWTMAERKEYFAYFTKERKKLPFDNALTGWFKDAGRPSSDGNSFNNFMKNFFREAVANLSVVERKELATMLDSIDKNATPTYDIKPRPVHKVWKMEEVLPHLEKVDKGRDFNKGRDAYFASSCIKCHRFGNEGGAVGPDLTAIASRFSRRDMLESILEPSKVISDQYQNITINTVAGKVITGRILMDTKEKVVIQPDPLAPDTIEVKRGDIDTMKASPVSPMPDKLADVLTLEEILDMIAFMESAGSKGYRSFKK